MGEPQHLEILNQGLTAWNRWRRDNPLVIPNLAGIEFKGDDLREFDFSRGYFSYGIPQPHGVETEAGFEGANLTRANLSFCNLMGVDLCGAKLCDADLFRTVMGKSSLRGANFSGSHMSGTVFAEVDLRGAKGLDRVHHTGPSTIGIDTIYISGGEIPESFLWGCGVPEQFITFARSLVAQAIEFHSCFISHSTEDHDFAERLHRDLRTHGVRCWFAPHDVQGGRKLHEQIDEAIRINDRLLLILSDRSMNSEWVKTEIFKARKRELRENRRMLFPVRLVEFEKLRDWECFDADTGKDSAREIREYFIPDFSNWRDPNEYWNAFERLLRDLRAH